MTARLPLRPATLGLVLAATATVAIGAGATVERDRLERLNIRETVLTAEQGRNVNQLARLLSVLEQLRRDPPPALLVSPENARDAVRAAILVKAMTPELQSRARIYAAEAGEIARQRRLAAVASEALFLDDSARADARGEPASAPPGAFADGAYAPGTPLPAQAAGSAIPPQALHFPVAGPVTHRFGEPTTGGGRSNGLTILTARGAQVASPGQGLVQYVGPVKGWGVILILRLAGGYHLVLAGLDRTSVEVGQSVAAGAPVGWMPDGRQSPSELYLEIREQGAPVDPARWLKVQAG